MVQTFPIPCVRAMCSNELGWLYASAPASTFKSDDSQPDLTSTAGVTTPTLAGHGSDVWLLLPANRLQLVQCLAQKNVSAINLSFLAFRWVSVHFHHCGWLLDNAQYTCVRPISTQIHHVAYKSQDGCYKTVYQF